MASESFIYYWNRFSVCSLQVRYTIAVRGEPKDQEKSYSFSETEIDTLGAGTHLDEDFLKINPKGQVPVLGISSTGKNVPDSVVITYLLADIFPRLLPESHRGQLKTLMEKLHAINFFSLTFGPRVSVDPTITKIHKRLEGDISPEYREALLYKLKVNQQEKASGLPPSVQDQNVQLTTAFLKECEEVLSEDASWLYGLPQPTAVDAHLVPFLARLRDAGRFQLVSPRLKAYLATAEKTPEWQNVMEGRRTLPEQYCAPPN